MYAQMRLKFQFGRPLAIAGRDRSFVAGRLGRGGWLVQAAFSSDGAESAEPRLGPRQLGADFILTWIEFQRSLEIRDRFREVVVGVPGDRTLVVGFAQPAARLGITRGRSVGGFHRLNGRVQPPGVEVLAASRDEGSHVGRRLRTPPRRSRRPPLARSVPLLWRKARRDPGFGRGHDLHPASHAAQEESKREPRAKPRRHNLGR